MKSIGSAVGKMLSGGRNESAQQHDQPQSEPVMVADTTYTAQLTSAEFEEGKTIQVVTQGPQGQEKLKVRVPPGSRAGQKLRLRGKGLIGPEGRGDLYLKLELAGN